MSILYIDIARVAEKVSNGRKPFSLGVHKPERHGLTVIAGNAKQYTTRIAVPNQSTNTTPPRAA